MKCGECFVDSTETSMKKTSVLLVLFATAACAANSVRSVTRGYGGAAVDGVARLRAATKSFTVLDSAVAAGYRRDVPNCVVHEHHGAMGYHHLNATYADGTLVPEHPQFLLYQRLANGTYQLTGAEFFAPYRYWPRDSTPPVLMGQPLLREDAFNYWYLHVWAWLANPDGLFADFNPNVTCLPGTAKIYTRTVLP
jgi:hypothetical protein